MSDFWTNLAAQIGTRPDVVQPRLPARFESPADVEADEARPVEVVEPGPQPMAAPPGRTDRPTEPDHRARVLPLPSLSTIAVQEPLVVTGAPALRSVSPAPEPAAPQAEALPHQLETPTVPRVPVTRQPQPTAADPSRVEPAIERQGAPPPPLSLRDETPAQPETSGPPVTSPVPLQPTPEETTQREEAGSTAPIVRLEDTIRPRLTLPPQPGMPPDLARNNAPPSVHVTIGRVEVRAVTPPQAQQPVHQSRPRFQPPMTLDAYLKRRSGGARE